MNAGGDLKQATHFTQSKGTYILPDYNTAHESLQVEERNDKKEVGLYLLAKNARVHSGKTVVVAVVKFDQTGNGAGFEITPFGQGQMSKLSEILNNRYGWKMLGWAHTHTEGNGKGPSSIDEHEQLHLANNVFGQEPICLIKWDGDGKWIQYQLKRSLEYVLKDCEKLTNYKKELENDPLHPHFYDSTHMKVDKKSDCQAFQEKAKFKRGDLHQAKTPAITTLDRVKDEATFVDLE